MKKLVATIEDKQVMGYEVCDIIVIARNFHSEGTNYTEAEVSIEGKKGETRLKFRLSKDNGLKLATGLLDILA